MIKFIFYRIVITPRPRLMADSRSTGRLQSSNAHRSMTRLNAGKEKKCRHTLPGSMLI